MAALDDSAVDQELIRTWFGAQLLKQAGHTPNLTATAGGDDLQAGQTYNFDHDNMSFEPHTQGHFQPDDIKFLRLLFSGNRPEVLYRINGLDTLLPESAPLVKAMLADHLRI